METDKNTIIGFILMALVVFGFLAYDNYKFKNNELARQEQLKNDSTAVKEDNDVSKIIEQNVDSITNEKDSISPLSKAKIANDGVTLIENELLKVYVSNKGGQLSKVELKDSTYKSQDKVSNVTLFQNDDFNLNFLFSGKEYNVKTDELYFVPSKSDSKTVVMKLPIANGNIEFSYSLIPNSYLLKFNIKADNLEGFFPVKTKSVDVIWNERMKQQEKGFAFENQHSTIEYREDRGKKGKTKVLNSGGGDKVKDNLEYPVDWLAFKDQFFSQVLIADKPFDIESISSKTDEEGSGYIKTYNAAFSTEFDPTGKDETNLTFYLGPNRFSTLRENEAVFYSNNDAGITKDNHPHLDLQSLVYLGWPLIRYINRFFTVYLFDFMTGLGLNMGIILLLLTILVKMLVFPLMKKSYLSSANMRVLKPKVDEINAKYPNKDDAMKKQQEVMQLYSQYGVSPMGGCLPMLIQMPIWIALFNFIPNAIELRGQKFLWADDLSTYDDVISWGHNIWGIGNHLSLFCVLWCLSTVINTWISMRQQKYTMTEEQQQQMGMMKWMSYLMPLIFFFSFNGYSSGLNYYYFISGIISILMMWYLRKTTDDDKLLKKLEARFERKKAQPNQSNMKSRFEKLMELQKQLEEQKKQQNRGK